VTLSRKKVKGETRGKTADFQPPASNLLSWYDRHRRILPWRALPGAKVDPYHVWLSEIMLQQTTVGAVGPYFHKFVTRWPTIQHLAKAPRGEVLKMWAGLGYYRRAHLLYECAQRICRGFGGRFPQSEAELKELPGFGPYTAAAVAAIAFDERASAVDGNVERVMARLFAIQMPLPKAKAELRAHAASLLPSARFGDYAQALMDLGATICTPRNPKCGLCPLAKSCRAHKLGIEEKLPRRLQTKAKPVRRAIAFFAVDGRGRVLLRKRPLKGLLGGMMEVPSSSWREGKAPMLAEAQKEAPLRARWKLLPGGVTHVFTHFTLEIVIAFARVEAKAAKSGKWVPLNGLDNEALPSIMRKIAHYGRAAL